MRIGILATPNRLWPKYGWVACAFRKLGHKVERGTGPDDIERLDGLCDVVVFNPKLVANWQTPPPKGRRRRKKIVVPPTALESTPRRAVWVSWMFDLLLMDRDQPPERQWQLFDSDGAPSDMLRVMRAADIALVKERCLVGSDILPNARWFDQGCPSWLGACEHRENPEFDVMVWGATKWQQRRRDVQALVKAGLKVAWAPKPGEGGVPDGVVPLAFHPPHTLPALASRAAVVFDCPYRDDVDGFWSDKLWLILGMGACHVRRRSMGLPNAPMVSCYDWGEMVATVDGLLADPDRRRTIGRQAREYVMANHTYEHRCRELLAVIGGAKACTSTCDSPASSDG